MSESVVSDSSVRFSSFCTFCQFNRAGTYLGKQHREHEKRLNRRPKKVLQPFCTVLTTFSRTGRNRPVRTGKLSELLRTVPSTCSFPPLFCPFLPLFCPFLSVSVNPGTPLPVPVACFRQDCQNRLKLLVSVLFWKFTRNDVY